MLTSNYQFRFSLIGTVFSLIGILIFSGLGTWQVFRALEKERLQLEMDSIEQRPVIQLNANVADIESIKYLKAEITGRYDSANEILIDNVVHNGKAGYHVMTPFILQADKAVIMVNRGWVPVGRDRKNLPELNAPKEKIKINGTIVSPRSKPPITLGKPDVESKVWLYFDARQFEKKSGHKVMPVVILLNKNDDYGYTREWPKYEVKIGMHIGYAIQWYVFALIVLATYLGVNFKKRTNNDKNLKHE